MAKRKPPRSKRARSRKLTEALVEWCRKEYAGGNPLMLLIAIDACLRAGSKVPMWTAQKFCDRIDQMVPRPGEDTRRSVQRATSAWRQGKRRLDAAMKAKRDEFCDMAAPIPHWILHDLRRTAATGMARLNIPPHVVDKVLNHVSGTIRGVAAVYNRFEYLEERRAALEAWGRYVDRLVTPHPSNLVALASR